MWNYETSIAISASPSRVWSLFEDVNGWGKWNAGIEVIKMRGPFANGSQFVMKPPGIEPMTSTLIDVRPGESFTDFTELDDTAVKVFHGLTPLGDGSVKVTYRASVEGPEADKIGPMATGDFDDVLTSLKAFAEAGSS